MARPKRIQTPGLIRHVKVTHPLSYTVWLFTRWSADGRGILTRGENNKGRLGFFRIDSLVFRKSGEMWFAPIDGGAPHKIDMPVTPGSGWRFDPKTDQVAFGVGSSREYEVWKLDKFLPAASLKR